MRIRALLATAGLAGSLAFAAAPALAQYTEPSTTPTISNTRDTDPSSSPTVKGSTIRRGDLGVTGADIAGIAVLGTGVVGTGALLVASSRRRARASS